MPTPDPLAARDLGWLLSDGLLDERLLDPAWLAAEDLDDTLAWPAPFQLSDTERADLREVLSGWPQATGPWPGGPVGRRFEALVAAWLDESSQLRLLARNWPLRDQERVVGEVDLLVERDGRRELWELACKWYLGVPGAGWIGPGLNDRLATKLDRLGRVQLTRVDHPAFVARWGAGFVARACLVGWLIPPLTHAAPVALGGRPPAAWVAIDQLDVDRLAQLVDTYRIEAWWWLAAGRWLRPADAFDVAQCVGPPLAPVGAAAVVTRPTAFAGMGTGADGRLSERFRLVLVPPGWAERASAAVFSA